jgi:TIR domain-containing protein
VTEPLPYQCFISYTRMDNEIHDGVVDRFKREVSGRFEAATGSRLEVFLDRESIGWGERWRDKISEAIMGSTLFVPIITMRYFNSTPCREELSAFHSAAAQNGVPDLILPIILAGSNQITSENSDDLVRVVAELNWQPIFNEFEAGYESSEWKRRIGQIVRGLQAALERAEAQLSNQATVALPANSDTDILESTDMEVIETRLTELSGFFDELNPIMEQISAASTERFGGSNLGQMTPAQRGVLLAALANDLREPAASFGAKASDFESTTRQLDAEFRALVAEMYSINPEETEDQLSSLRTQIGQSFADTQEAFNALDQVEKAMRMAALGSVKLRKALSPMTTGMRSLGTAIRIIMSWQSIDPSGTGNTD